MKYMNTINKLQAALTELRREIQRSEVPKCNCGTKTIMTDPLYAPPSLMCPVHGTAGQCTCVSGVVGEDCPIHGMAGKPKCLCETESFCPIHTITWRDPPDLPLHVRVAKALGQNPFFDYVGYCSIEKARKENLGAWCYATENHRSNLIPDYPNDLVAAMEALEEYCKGRRNFSISHYPDYPKIFRVSVWGEIKCGEKSNLSEKNNNDLPQAICEAIVAHAEEK